MTFIQNCRAENPCLETANRPVVILKFELGPESWGNKTKELTTKLRNVLNN